MSDIFDAPDMQRLILTGIEDELNNIPFNKGFSHEFSFQLFFVLRESSADIQKKAEYIFFNYCTGSDEDYVKIESNCYPNLSQIDINPSLNCIVYGVNNIKLERRLSKTLLALNGLCDIALLANTGDSIECVFDAAKNTLTKEHSQIVLEYVLGIPKTPSIHYVEDIEAVLNEYEELSDSFKSVMTRGYIEDNDKFEIKGFDKDELTYIFGDFKKNHYCNICYIADAEQMAGTSELPDDVFTYESKAYISSINGGTNLVETKTPPLCKHSFIPQRDVLVFACENANNVNLCKFFGVYKCKIDNQDCRATFTRIASKVDIFSLKIDRLKKNEE